jgi:hypothetical protein
MPVTRREQNNTTFYVLIAFVALFLIAAVTAVIFYSKFESQRTRAETLQEQKDELATNPQFQKRGATIGTIKRGETYIGKMTEYLDRTASLILGAPLDETSADVKIEKVNQQIAETLASLVQSHDGLADIDPNTAGLLRIIQNLRNKLDETIAHVVELEQTLTQLRKEYETVKDAGIETEKNLLSEKEQLKQQVDKIQQDYDNLKAQLEQTTDEKVKALEDERNQAKTQQKSTYDRLLKTQAELGMTREKLQRVQAELWKIDAPPDSNVPAYKPDGQIMAVENNIIQLNIGTDEQVYRGQTFAVYDKGMPIPPSGRGKAEIQVYDVEKNVSLARVIRSEKRRPIVAEDIVANLVWDSERTNVFVVAGEFDLDGDRAVDLDAPQKITELIEKWGGRVVDNVSPQTDYLVLGTRPPVPAQPTPEQTVADPLAMERYDAAVKRRDRYNTAKKDAANLWVPVFNTERFLYFIGYKTLSARPDAF